MTSDGGNGQATFDDLNRKQLEIYAKELQMHFIEERRLRQELYDRNQQLELRVQEITALNQLFKQHLDQRFEAARAFKDLLKGLANVSEAIDGINNKAKSYDLPDADEIGVDLSIASRAARRASQE